MAPDDFALTDFTTATGLHACAGVDIAAGRPVFLFGYEDGFVDLGGFEDLIAGQPCPATQVEGHPRTYHLDCGTDGFEKIIGLLTPTAFESTEPDGGFVVAIDIPVEIMDQARSGLEFEADRAALYSDVARLFFEEEGLLSATPWFGLPAEIEQVSDDILSE